MAINFEKLKEKYNKLTEDKAESNSDFLNKFLRLDMGTTMVRILPWRDDSNEFYAETKIHRLPWSKGDLEGKASNVHCLKSVGGKCPLCDYYYALWKNPTEENKSVARKIKPRERYYMNVLVRETGDIKILSVGQKLFGTVVNSVLDPDYGDITSLKEGNDFKVIKDTMKGSNGQEFPNYDKSAPRPKKSAVAETKKAVDNIMADLHDIHGLVKHESYEDVKKKVQEFINGVSSDFDFRPTSTESTEKVSSEGDSVEEFTKTESEVTDEEYLKRLEA